MSLHARWNAIFSPEEFRSLSRIAAPLILASLVTMSISITDVVMIGRLGTLQLAAGAAASDFYSIFFYLAAGIVAAISALIANARGRREHRAVRNTTLAGALAGLLAAVPAAAMIYNAPFFLSLVGVKPDIVAAASPYARLMAITVFPMLMMMVLHHFLAAHGKTRVILYVTACALPVNILGNYALIYGNFGMPPLGLAGAAIATISTGCFMFLALLAYALLNRRLRRYWYLPASSRSFGEHLREVFRVGLPIGVSMFGEMGVFLFATVTMGMFGAEVLAAHTIALRAAGVVYAVPMGYSQAATVRVGYLFGQANVERLRRAIKTALSLSLGFGMLLLALVALGQDSITHWVLAPEQISDTVVSQAALFLVLLAAMQPSICLGTIGNGVLRGFKDTKVPMYFSLAGYWGFGFVGAMGLALIFGLGGLGIWIGLLTASVSFALFVLNRIRVKHWVVPAGVAV